MGHSSWDIYRNVPSDVRGTHSLRGSQEASDMFNSLKGPHRAPPVIVKYLFDGIHDCVRRELGQVWPNAHINGEDIIHCLLVL